MTTTAQKIPLQVTLGQLASQKATGAIGELGRSLPASIVSVNGGIAKVKIEVLSAYNFPIIEVPIAGDEYARAPYRAGDKGYLIPCDASIDGVSGTNETTADMSRPSNLSSLVFHPIGNKKWKAVDPSMYVLTGYSDVMLRDDTHQLQLEDENASWVSLISQINQLLQAIATQINAAALTNTGIPPVVFTPITSTTNPVKARV